MSLGTLYTVDAQDKGKIIRAAAILAGIELDLPQGYVHFTSNKEAPFLSKFPHGKIPAWDGKDGLRLFEGYAIARYIAGLNPNSGLLGHSAADAALIDQWYHLAEVEVDLITSEIRDMCANGRLAYSKPNHATFLERQARALTTLENHIATRTFFVGERITLADLAVASFFARAVGQTVDAAARPKYPHLIRHAETIYNQPKLKALYGPIQYVEKGIQFTPPPKEKKEKEAKPAPAPKAEKPKAKPKEEEEEEEPLVPAEPKAKNPLDDLPKSTFNLEDWKRAYSNLDTRGPGGSLEWFYKNFDKEGFSIWRVDFKYNNELTQTFMSSNQIGGFFNRLEASRKYLFGSVGVLGETNNSVISGALILRGLDVKPVIDVAPDWESYSYEKIDLSDEKQKAFFEAALAWDLEIDGKKWVDGKNFK